LGGKSVAYWGHGKDSSVDNPKGIKSIAEQTKIWLSRRADGFFAYTNGVCDYLVNNGVDRRKIFVLQNTIDISRQRAVFNKLIGQRDALRSEAGLNGKKVLLFVGRLTKQKQPAFLFDAFRVLQKSDKSYHLMMVGGGDTSLVDRFRSGCGERSFTYLGATDDIGRFCVMSDLYVLPGAIGLGPVHALCYDLTPVVIHSRVHKPEYEYLNSENALILPEDSTAREYASAIKALLEDRGRWCGLRAQAWPSIKHLTIDSMAQNFIDGVSSILQRRNGTAK
jgi:glycosyltransferase involved in cell wall biosynthesis